MGHRAGHLPLKRIYGESWESFISNSGAVQYFGGGRERATPDYFSALCGVATVQNFSNSTSCSTSHGKDGSSRTYGASFNLSFVQRKLPSPMS